MTEIKPRTVPFCDCTEAEKRYKSCLTRPSTFFPTLVKGNFCRFCGEYVTWKPAMVPYCKCPELNAVYQGKEIRYSQSEFDEDEGFKLLGSLEELEELPTDTKDTFRNRCYLCGDLVQWRLAKKKKKG